MKKKVLKIALALVIVFFASVLIQFGYNMLFVSPVVNETTKGGDGKLTEMLYESEFLEDSYFADATLISANLEGAIERIDVREDCADFTACGLIRFYIENEHRLAEKNKAEIKACLTGFKYWMDQYDGRADSMCHWSENHQILFATTEYLAGNLWQDATFADGKVTLSGFGDEELDGVSFAYTVEGNTATIKTDTFNWGDITLTIDGTSMAFTSWGGDYTLTKQQ